MKMKKTTSRMSALALSTVMCLGMVPSTALADIISIPAEEFAFEAFPCDAYPGPSWKNPDGSVTYPPSREELEQKYGTYELTLNFDGCTTRFTVIGANEEDTCCQYMIATEPRQGREIIGWEDESGNYYDVHNIFDNVTRDMTATAVWDAYTVTFDTNGASMDIPSQEVHYRDTIDFPEDPEREGYDFIGWYTKSGERWSEDEAVRENVTLYAKWEKVRPKYWVNFNTNGAYEAYISQEVAEENTVKLPKDPTRKGYKFLGWYTGTLQADGTLANAVEWTEDRTVTGPTTLYALWEKIPEACYTVTLDLNGAPDEPLGPFEIKEDHAAVLYEPYWKGHTFLGWYYDREGTRPFAGSALTLETISADTTLYAKWESAKVTVTFDMNGLPAEDIEPMIVDCNTTIELPEVTAPAGYLFQGWSYLIQDGKAYLWDEEKPVTKDMTLTAIWKERGEDTYNFNNSSAYFTDYCIDKAYFDYLTQNDSLARKEEIYQDFYFDEWGGSCFGMSAVYCMARAGMIDLDVFQGGAEYLLDLNYPKDDQGVHNLLNYYMIAQSAEAGNAYKVKYMYNLTNRGWVEAPKEERLREIIRDYWAVANDGSEKNDYTLLGFGFRYYKDGEAKTGGHAIVIKDIEKAEDGNYHLTIWDPNYPKTNGELIVSGDCRSVRFSEDTNAADRYNNKLNLKYIMPVGNKGEHFDALSLQDFIEGKSVRRQDVSNDLYKLSFNVADFTVTSATGETAVVRNGEQVSGDLVLLPYSLEMGESDEYQYYINAADAQGMTIDVNGKDAEVEFVSDEMLAQVEADQLKTVNIAENTVSTVCADAAEQKITLVSEELGDEWNKLTISGKDTGFALDVKEEQATVKSDNAVSVEVVGANVSSRAESAKQKVSVTPEGATISTAKGKLTATNAPAAEAQPSAPAETPKANPFTDVAESAYYHKAVLWAVENGITAGTSATTFGPKEACTRAQIVTFLWRAAGSPEPSSTVNPFTDVKETDYYYKAVLWAVENGITAGTTATTFGPKEACNRAQTVSFLYRTAGKPAVKAADSPFQDVKAGAYYEDAVLWAVENGITAGTSPTTFGPADTCTRGQIVTFLWKFDSMK